MTINNVIKTLDTFVQYTQLKPADAVVVKKEPFSLLDHYIIYLGQDKRKHLFIANYTKGTRILSEQEISEYADDFKPERIRRFVGNDLQRQTAVQRALSRQDQSSYHLLLNNCEHYSNYVQTGTPFSQQTKTFGSSLVLAGLATAASTRKPALQTFGLVATAIGLITLLLDEK